MTQVVLVRILPFFQRVTFQTNDLFRTGPRQVFRLNDVGRDRHGPSFDATAIHLFGDGCLATFLFLLSFAGDRKLCGFTKASSMSRRS